MKNCKINNFLLVLKNINIKNLQILFFKKTNYIKNNFNQELLSLSYHFLKSIVALYINWLILNRMTNDDYVIWSITSSILMISTASDLGIGQHTVTLLVNSEKTYSKIIITNALLAIVPLFFFSFFFLLIFLPGLLYYKLCMAIFVSLRLFSIPFGALLNATNNFKKRKFIEFLSYLFAAIMIGFIVKFNKEIQLSLLALNFSFILAAILIIYESLKSLSNIEQKKISFNYKQVFSVFRGTLPFLINNITSLLTYGGFIWISSIILPRFQIAKLSVLHNFLLMTMYQIYDVFLRSKQADLIDLKKIKFHLKLNRFILLFVPIFNLLFGKIILNLIAPKLSFTLLEIFTYSIFLNIEFSFLLLQSIIQVDIKFSKYLITYSIIKIFSILVFFFVFFNLNYHFNLFNFILFLNLFSILGLLIINFHFKLKTGYSL